MTTERQAHLVIEHTQRFAAGFHEAAQLARQQIRDGDPAGIGIARLCGQADAYADCARRMEQHADEIRADERPFKLQVVS